MRYEWDSGKARENLRKHRVDFVDAIAVLEHPNRIEDPDERLAYGEDRVRVIGMANRRVLFVVITMRNDETCRIISARRATHHEQNRYYASDCNTW